MMQLKYWVVNTDQAAEKLLACWDLVPTEVHFFRSRNCQELRSGFGENGEDGK
jgi:hypothetical protein